MQSLNKNWITENHIDFEYKKYILLAYLQHVSDNFTEQRLYPYLADLIDHYRNLRSIKDNKQVLFNQFPERLTGSDTEEFRLIYEKMVQDDNLMQEIENILDYSIPQMENSLNEGKKIYDVIEDKLKIIPIGVIPLFNEDGYIFLKSGSSTDAHVYEYHISFFENPIEKFRSIQVNFIATYEKNIMNTYEAIKSDLVRFNKNLPNPATYAIETDMAIPFEETFLPLVKRAIVKRIAGNA